MIFAPSSGIPELPRERGLGGASEAHATFNVSGVETVKAKGPHPYEPWNSLMNFGWEAAAALYIHVGSLHDSLLDLGERARMSSHGINACALHGRYRGFLGKAVKYLGHNEAA